MLFFYIICLQVCTSYLECYARIEIVGYVYLHCSYVNTKCMINISRASLPSGSSCDSKVKINMKYMIMSANMNFLSDQAIFTNALLQNPLYISTFHKMNFNSHLLSNLTAWESLSYTLAMTFLHVLNFCHVLNFFIIYCYVLKLCHVEFDNNHRSPITTKRSGYLQLSSLKSSQ